MIAANLMFQAFASSDFWGKQIFIALFVLSFCTWALLIYKLFVFSEVRRLAIDFKDVFYKKGGSFFQLEGSLSKMPTKIPHVFLEIYRVLKSRSLDLLKKNQALLGGDDAYLSVSDLNSLVLYVQSVIACQKKELEKFLFFLSTVVSLAPFLGLLGTVWGILLTFGSLQARVTSASDTALSGLSMALATTVLGLVVAIPALIAYNYLKQSVREMEVEMEDIATKMLAKIELLYRRVDLR